MSRIKGIVARIRAMLRPEGAEQRMEEEFAFHVEMEATRLQAGGIPSEEARRQALVTFGGLDRYREEMRDGRGARWLDDAVADLRYALRITRRSKAFALAVALTLGVGIGVNGFTFGVVDSVLIRPVPARAPEQLVAVFPRNARTGRVGNFAYDDYADFRDRSGVFAGMAGMTGVPLNLVAKGSASSAADMVWGEMVTENYFSVLDMTPAAGRFFTPADAPQGANPFAVLSYTAWQHRFGGDPNVVGRAIRVNGTEFTITGVAPKGFRGMRTFGFWPELWVPAGMYRTILPGTTGMLEGRGRGWIITFARMRDGWDIDRTHTAATLFAHRLERQFPDANRHRGVVLLPARSGFENPQFVKPQVVVLSSALGIVASVITLLVICANLINMQLARAAARAREIAIRLSLGCSRTRLARQLLLETLVLALPGAAVAATIVAATPLIEPLMLPRLQFRVGMDIVPNVRVAVFTVVVALAAVLLLGLIPALRAMRRDLAPLLVRDAAGQRGPGRRRITVRATLVVSQLAMSVVLLVGGVLFARSLHMARASDLGFDARDRLLVSVNVGLQGYDENRGRRFYDDVISRVRARPDVVSASWVFPAPFDTHGRGFALYVDDAGNTTEAAVSTSVSFVGEDFVEALGLRLSSGRGFGPNDAAIAPGVMVISRSLAARLWPRQDAVGRQARIGSASGPQIAVIGVVGDARFQSLGDTDSGRAYLPLRQNFRDWETLVVHTRGDPRAALPRIRNIVAAADPALPVFGVMTMEEAVESGLSSSRTAAAAAGFFGAVALLIAALGLYAVVASSVTERTREIGVRLALGSTPRGVMRHVMAAGIRLGAWGVALGVVAALAVARAMAQLLFGVRPFDPVTFAAVPLILFVVVLAATYLPARRAVKLDPVAALRTD